MSFMAVSEQMDVAHLSNLFITQMCGQGLLLLDTFSIIVHDLGLMGVRLERINLLRH